MMTVRVFLTTSDVMYDWNMILYSCFTGVVVGLQQTILSVQEDVGTVNVCVELTGQIQRSVVISLATIDGSASSKTDIISEL